MVSKSGNKPEKDLFAKGVVVVNDVDDVCNSLLKDNKKINTLYSKNRKNKKQVAYTFQIINAFVKHSNKHGCSIISEDLKLLDLAHEDVVSKDNSFQAAIYLKPDNSYILKVELERKSSGGFDSDKKVFEFDIKVDYDNLSRGWKTFELDVERKQSYVDFGSVKFMKILKNKKDSYPWEDYSWDPYVNIHYSDKWFYKQNPAEIVKTFLDAIDTSSLSSKYDNLRELLP